MILPKSANNIQIWNENIFFSSNNSIFYLSNTYSLKLYISLQSLIIGMKGTSNYLFVLTTDHVYAINNKIYGKMKFNSSIIYAKDNFIVLSKNRILYIFEFKKRSETDSLHKFMLLHKICGHYKEICCINWNQTLRTGSYDCSIREYDLKNNTSKRILNTKDIPVFINDNLTILRNGTIIIFKDNKNEFDKNEFERIYLNENVLSCSENKNYIYLLTIKSLIIIKDSKVIEKNNLIDTTNYDNHKIDTNDINNYN
ncbi:hypothetical protein DMUE_6271, partial [Dictyocoela muelleri]